MDGSVEISGGCPSAEWGCRERLRYLRTTSSLTVNICGRESVLLTEVPDCSASAEIVGSSSGGLITEFEVPEE